MRVENVCALMRPLGGGCGCSCEGTGDIYPIPTTCSTQSEDDRGDASTGGTKTKRTKVRLELRCRRPAIMWTGLLLVLGTLELGLSQRLSQLQWLSRLRGRRRPAGWPAPDPDCPLECDCPPAYPTAMYCHGRGLQHVPYVPSHVKYVYLQHNRIAGIPDGVFDGATALVWVVLFHNQLSSDKVGKNVFAKLRRLERLFLEHNELMRVPPNLPTSITDLRLGHNRISQLLPGSFEGMANLTSLQLQANDIEDAGDAFRGLKSLTTLDMSRNRLGRIPEHLPEGLQQLYLEFNSVDRVPAGFLAAAPQLQFVRLAHNKLRDGGLPANAFNVSTLVELDLSFNKLERIPVVSRNLENLYLQANEIKEFSLSSFCSTVDMTTFSRLRVLRLDSNHISAKDIPAEAAYCLRRVAFIDV
ncbi:fibromodulin-like [Betta splendens]|uniref:Fibromodulin n=1 Tax=Betta splendens TaxID=158456 RepID=A0A9W2XXG1_BETSP|nr:fibromodulin-like [Betta splendens]